MSQADRAGEGQRRSLGRSLRGLRQRLTRHQRTTFLLASGVSTAGSFAGLTAKGWLLMEGAGNPLLLAVSLNFSVNIHPSSAPAVAT